MTYELPEDDWKRARPATVYAVNWARDYCQEHGCFRRVFFRTMLEYNGALMLFHMMPFDIGDHRYFIPASALQTEGRLENQDALKDWLDSEHALNAFAPGVLHQTLHPGTQVYSDSGAS